MNICKLLDKKYENGYIYQCLRYYFYSHFQVLSKIPASFEKIEVDRANPIYAVYQRPHIQLNKNNKVSFIHFLN